jgi:hypothetical protein
LMLAFVSVLLARRFQSICCAVRCREPAACRLGIGCAVCARSVLHPAVYAQAKNCAPSCRVERVVKWIGCFEGIRVWCASRQSIVFWREARAVIY